MNYINPKWSLVAMVIMSSILLVSAPALAEKGGHGYGHEGQKEKYKAEKNVHEKKGKKSSNVIISSDRDVILSYFNESHRAKCPPGLAKKHNGCLPPGQAKKYYRGQTLPGTVVWQPLPEELVVRLRPPPHGARYVVVDQNVLLITEATRKILDAVTLLSAVQ